MAETSGLLNRRTGYSRTEGSNPSVSAKAAFTLSQPASVRRIRLLGQSLMGISRGNKGAAGLKTEPILVCENRFRHRRSTAKPLYAAYNGRYNGGLEAVFRV